MLLEAFCHQLLGNLSQFVCKKFVIELYNMFDERKFVNLILDMIQDLIFLYQCEKRKMKILLLNLKRDRTQQSVQKIKKKKKLYTN